MKYYLKAIDTNHHYHITDVDVFIKFLLPFLPLGFREEPGGWRVFQENWGFVCKCTKVYIGVKRPARAPSPRRIARISKRSAGLVSIPDFLLPGGDSGHKSNILAHLFLFFLSFLTFFFLFFMRRYRGGLAGRGVHAVRNVQKVSYLLRHRCFRSECVIILDSKIASEYVGLWIQSHFWQVEKKGLQDVITKAQASAARRRRWETLPHALAPTPARKDEQLHRLPHKQPKVSWKRWLPGFNYPFSPCLTERQVT